MNNDTQAQIAALKSQIDDLTGAFYKNNFNSHQDFNKSSSFNSSLKIPVFTSLPACEVGQICGYTTGGTTKLMICSATNTWTVCGTQS